MRSAEKVLEEYRKADFHHRLNLYLDHRDLRQSFMKIDLELPAFGKSAGIAKNTSRIQALMGSVRYKIARCCFP